MLTKKVEMVNLVYMICFLCVCGVSGDVNVSLESIIERLEYLENKVSELEDINAGLRRQNTGLQLEVTKAKTHTGKRFVLEQSEGIVAFTAAISPMVVNDVKDKETIKFDTMVTSVGGGYNNLTGVFVAPISGIYMFSCSLLDHWGIESAHNGAMLHAEIIHNQRLLARVFAHAETSYRDQGAQTVIAEVNQGDQVFVRSIDNPDLGLGGEFYSTFSGYLLQMI